MKVKQDPFQSLKNDTFKKVIREKKEDNISPSSSNVTRKIIFIDKRVNEKVKHLSFWNGASQTSIINKILRLGIQKIEADQGVIPVPPDKERFTID